MDIKGSRNESVLKWRGVLSSLCLIVCNSLLRCNVPCILIYGEIDDLVKG
jgi:hypothetical protein